MAKGPSKPPSPTKDFGGINERNSNTREFVKKTAWDFMFGDGSYKKDFGGNKNSAPSGGSESSGVQRERRSSATDSSPTPITGKDPKSLTTELKALQEIYSISTQTLAVTQRQSRILEDQNDILDSIKFGIENLTKTVSSTKTTVMSAPNQRATGAKTQGGPPNTNGNWWDDLSKLIPWGAMAAAGIGTAIGQGINYFSGQDVTMTPKPLGEGKNKPLVNLNPAGAIPDEKPRSREEDFDHIINQPWYSRASKEDLIANYDTMYGAGSFQRDYEKKNPPQFDPDSGKKLTKEQINQRDTAARGTPVTDAMGNFTGTYEAPQEGPSLDQKQAQRNKFDDKREKADQTTPSPKLDEKQKAAFEWIKAKFRSILGRKGNTIKNGRSIPFSEMTFNMVMDQIYQEDVILYLEKFESAFIPRDVKLSQKEYNAAQTNLIAVRTAAFNTVKKELSGKSTPEDKTPAVPAPATPMGPAEPEAGKTGATPAPAAGGAPAAPESKSSATSDKEESASGSKADLMKRLESLKTSGGISKTLYDMALSDLSSGRYSMAERIIRQREKIMSEEKDPAVLLTKQNINKKSFNYAGVTPGSAADTGSAADKPAPGASPSSANAGDTGFTVPDSTTSFDKSAATDTDPGQKLEYREPEVAKVTSKEDTFDVIKLTADEMSFLADNLKFEAESIEFVTKVKAQAPSGPAGGAGGGGAAPGPAVGPMGSAAGGPPPEAAKTGVTPAPAAGGAPAAPAAGAATTAAPAAGGTGGDTPPKNVKVQPSADLNGVDPDLKKRFFAMAAEYGKPISVDSAKRSDEKQAELWIRGWILKDPSVHMPATPSRAMPGFSYQGQKYDVPGPKGGKPGSPHLIGGALDVNTSPGAGAGLLSSSGLLQKHGLVWPLGPKDPPHIQKLGGTPPSGDKDPSAGTPAPPSGATSTASAAPVSASPASAAPSAAGGGSAGGGGGGGGGGSAGGGSGGSGAAAVASSPSKGSELAQSSMAAAGGDSKSSSKGGGGQVSVSQTGASKLPDMQMDNKTVPPSRPDNFAEIMKQHLGITLEGHA